MTVSVYPLLYTIPGFNYGFIYSINRQLSNFISFNVLNTIDCSFSSEPSRKYEFIDICALYIKNINPMSLKDFEIELTSNLFKNKFAENFIYEYETLKRIYFEYYFLNHAFLEAKLKFPSLRDISVKMFYLPYPSDNNCDVLREFVFKESKNEIENRKILGELTPFQLDMFEFKFQLIFKSLNDGVNFLSYIDKVDDIFRTFMKNIAEKSTLALADEIYSKLNNSYEHIDYEILLERVFEMKDYVVPFSEKLFKLEKIYLPVHPSYKENGNVIYFNEQLIDEKFEIIFMDDNEIFTWTCFNEKELMKKCVEMKNKNIIQIEKIKPIGMEQEKYFVQQIEKLKKYAKFKAIDLEIYPLIYQFNLWTEEQMELL